MLRTAVIDARRIGKVHAVTAAVHPQARLVLVCDPFIEAAKALVEPLRARASADTARAFSADDVGVVVIGSPTPLHAGHVLAATCVGKAALHEKLVVSSVKATRAPTDELVTFGHPLVMVGSQRHYDPSIARTQRLVAEGRTGRIEQLTIVSRDPTPSSAEYLAQSGGVFKGITIHDFGEARFFLGKVASISAIGQRLSPALADVDDFDGAVTTLRAAGDAVVTIKNTRHCASGYDQKVEVFGSGGEVVAENLCATPVQVNGVMGSTQQEVYLDFFLERYTGAYRDELTVFIGTVNNGSPVTPTVEDGVATLVLAEATERSVHNGQVVEVTR